MISRRLIGWYQYAADLTKGADAGLIRKVSDLKMKGFEREIAAHEEFLPLTTPVMNCMRKSLRN